MCAGLHKPTGATIAGKMLFLVAAMAAERERDLIHERTMDGLAAAAAQGRTGGRPAAVDADTLAVARARRSRGESVTRIANHLGIGRSTLYRTLQHHDQDQSTEHTTVAETTAPSNADPLTSRECPTCGHEPISHSEAVQQRDDLATVWLHLDGTHIREQRHCADCQPHSDVLFLECARCADGPLVTGAPTDANGQLPPVINTWLIDHNWQTSPELICHETPWATDVPELLDRATKSMHSIAQRAGEA